MFKETDIFDGLELPLEQGAARLEAGAQHCVASVAPFNGQSIAVADALLATLGMTSPPIGRCGQSDVATIYWRAPGQWLVFGSAELISQTKAALGGMASVVDMSDAFCRVVLVGEAANMVLARLVAVDLERLEVGEVAHTALSDIPVTLISIEAGFEVLMPRSLARSAVGRLKVAMQSVAVLASMS